jgi:hypothetical protein
LFVHQAGFRRARYRQVPSRPCRKQSVRRRINHSGSVSLALPIGKGRPLLPGIKGIPRILIGDWNLSYVYTYQSGPPIVFSNMLLTGNPKDIPLGSADRTAAQWFNVNVFNRVTAQQLANNLITLSPTFAGIRAAAYNSSDASLIKQIPIHESVRLEVRIDGLNIFNQVSFGVPNTTPTSTAFGAVTTQKNVSASTTGNHPPDVLTRRNSPGGLMLTRHKAALSLALVLSCAAVRAQDEVAHPAAGAPPILPVGSPAPDFNLPGIPTRPATHGETGCIPATWGAIWLPENPRPLRINGLRTALERRSGWKPWFLGKQRTRSQTLAVFNSSTKFSVSHYEDGSSWGAKYALRTVLWGAFLPVSTAKSRGG